MIAIYAAGATSSSSSSSSSPSFSVYRKMRVGTWSSFMTNLEKQGFMPQNITIKETKDRPKMQVYV